MFAILQMSENWFLNAQFKKRKIACNITSLTTVLLYLLYKMLILLKHSYSLEGLILGLALLAITVVAVSYIYIYFRQRTKNVISDKWDIPFE